MHSQRTYSVSANLIQLWLTQFDRGELNDEEAEASVIAEYEARIAALERKVGQLTMELDLQKRMARPVCKGVCRDWLLIQSASTYPASRSFLRP
jgi:transposase